MSLGGRIKVRRQRLKLTQHELGKALGLTPQHISAIEQDKRSPSIASLAKMADELGVTIDYLVRGKEGDITDTIPAIKADKTLKLETKRALIALIRALRDRTRLEEVES